MGVRKKGRTRFECLGEYFHWYCDDYSLRVASEDKSLVVKYYLIDQGILEIHGHRFPGIDRTAQRPVRVLVPESVSNEFSNSIGAFVNALIRWCLDESHTLEYYDEPNKQSS